MTLATKQPSDSIPGRPRSPPKAGFFIFAIAAGKAQNDPTFALRGALAPVKPGHHAAVTEPKAFGALLRAIDGYAGERVSCAVLRLLPLAFVRPGELCLAEWAEFDLDRAPCSTRCSACESTRSSISSLRPWSPGLTTTGRSILAQMAVLPAYRARPPVAVPGTNNCD